jgi:nitroreductase
MTQGNDHISPEALLALLKERRSIRRYRPDPVPDEMVEQLLEAGRWAPSASNRQPWEFIVIHDETIRRQVAQHAASTRTSGWRGARSCCRPKLWGWEHVGSGPWTGRPLPAFSNCRIIWRSWGC